ncbi:MAG: HAMP domain-containing protein [Ignavibacteriales bacterium]|nr:HAMP domain-containing protein [Ignavibacteriales bacterium]
MKSLQTRITVTYLVLALLIVTGTGFLSSSGVESFFKQHLVNSLNQQVDLVAYFLQRSSSLSFVQIDSAVRRISGIENIRITLVNADGKVIADSDVPPEKLSTIENHLSRPEIQDALKANLGTNTRRSATVGRDFLYAAKALDSPLEGEFFRDLKFIRLSIPLEEVEAEISSIRFNILLAGFIVLVLITGISILVSRRLSKPMVQIARSLERIRSGDLNEYISVNSKDEIGRVASAVNELVEKMKDDIVRLERLESVRSEFLGNVSHELRTPIFAVQGYIETLLNGAVDDPNVNRSFLEKAHSNAHRLNSLLADLINISQIESGEMKMSFRYFRINDFLETTAKDFQPAAQQLGVGLKLELRTNDTTEVYGDRERILQVMANLIENALRYNKQSGEVVVSSRGNNGKVEITVKDTGVGIAPEHLPRIFERFYRVDTNRSREVGGTGLGLAIVKHILEAHETSAEVESKPGEGTSFSFSLRMG